MSCQNKGVTTAKNDTFGKIYFIRHYFVASSVAETEFLSRIPDHNFFLPGSRVKMIKKRICIKGFKYFNPKNTNKIVSKLSEN